VSADIYINFGGDLKGDSTDAKHSGQVEVNSWVHQIQQPKSAITSSAGGHSSARSEHGEMTFTKSIDGASPRLWQACSNGSIYNKVQITFYRALGGKNASGGQNRVPYLVIDLKDVLVASVNINVAAASELPSETFGLKYASVQWTYTTLKNDGTSAKGAVTAWNLQTNTATF
jgi:type VI secretion system secreted protein Hcp